MQYPPQYALSLVSALRTVAVAALALGLLPGVSNAAPPELFGSLVGSVRNSAGVPQMGAVVYLYNRHDKLVERLLTNVNGEFAFSALPTDMYSIRVTLSSFVPALKRNISIQPGMQSVLAINLASVLSSVELVYSAPNSGTLMSDEWKWVLRSSMATRPVLRVIPVDIDDPTAHRNSTATMFRDTRGLVKLSTGETASPFAAISNTPDLGTTFALATSLHGRNQVQFSGNLGYAASSAMPAAGFRTSFSRSDIGPAVKLTMQQVSLPSRVSPLFGGHQSTSAPALRTLSLTMIERVEIGDGMELNYGSTLDSVQYLDRLNYISPFALLRYRAGPGTLSVGYSSGAPPVDLLHRTSELDQALQTDVAALSVLPRVSLRGGRAHVQRNENMEIGYSVKAGSRTYSIGLYKEFIRNAALTMTAPVDWDYGGDLLPELSSNSYVFNVGSFGRSGYTASVTQSMSDDFNASVAYGRGGVLNAVDGTLQSNNPEELRAMVRRAQRHWARVTINGVAPGTGTRFVASYEWTDSATLMPSHVYLTQTMQPESGLNLRLRQPLPRIIPLPGRVEATAEMRNLLAQGYLPISASGGRRILLAHYPRAVRGGISFIF